MINHLYRRTHVYVKLVEMLEESCLLLNHSGHFSFFTDFHPGQLLEFINNEFAMLIRNRIAMWVEFRSTQEDIQLVHQQIGAHMLQLFCDIMYLIPSKLQLL